MSDKRKAQRLWDELYAAYKDQPLLSDTSDLWCSEWSWSGLCDGILSSHHEKYPYIQIKDGIVFYATGTNYRVYAIWDLFDNEEDCDSLCSRKNSCGYEWDVLFNRKLSEYGLKSDVNKYRMKKYGWTYVGL